MNAPVIIFAYNRKEHLKKTIGALAAAKMAGETSVFIYSDAAKNAESAEKVQRVREYLEELKDTHPFAHLRIIKVAANKGLSKSIVEGVSEVINEYGRVIVLEDDIVVASDFLIYMNTALDFYENEKKIWSVSGYVENFSFLKRYAYQTFAYPRADCWGWGTWADRWKLVDWEVSDYGKFAFSPVRRYRFNRGGEDLSRMLDAQMAGAIDSWAVRWCYSAYKYGMMSIHPTVSRVENIGLDGSGEHCKDQSRTGYGVPEMNTNCKMMPAQVDKQICKKYTNCIKQKYSGSYRFRKTIKNFIRRIRYFAKRH